MYKDQIDHALLKKRLEDAAIVPEWKLFGAFAVKLLGMPEEAVPFCEEPKRSFMPILDFMLETGNFGHNRDYSYYRKYPFLVRKAISLWRKGGDIVHHFTLFPANSFRYFFRFLSLEFLNAAKRK